MIEFKFNRQDYDSYKDFYVDAAIKLGSVGIVDYYDTSNFEYDPNILWEFLLCQYAYLKKDIKITFINFDREKIKNYKNMDDYNWNIILGVLERFVEEFPNSKLEYVENIR